MKCGFCELDHVQVIYEDEEVIAGVKDNAFTPGQVTVFPREHFTIMEMVPDELLAKCMALANKVGMAVFDSLEAQGSNVIVQNGTGAGQKIPHFGIEIIPRREGDGLSLEWKPKQMMEDDLEQVLAQIKEGENEAPKEKKVMEEAEKKDKVTTKNKHNYLIKSIKRIP